MFGKIKVSSIIPGLKRTDAPNNHVGSHHQACVEQSRTEVVRNLGGGGERKGLRPVKGIGGRHAGAKNPPGRCRICNCILGVEQHSRFKSCGRNK